MTQVLSEHKYHFVYLVITRGKKHRFLVININIRQDKKIEIEIKGKSKQKVEAFQQDIGATLTSTGDRHIITVDKCFEQLSEENSEILYSVTDKI